VLSKIQNGVATLTRADGETTTVAAELDGRRAVCIEIAVPVPMGGEKGDARIRTLIHENTELKHRLKHLLSEYESIKTGMEAQKQLEYRLVQQQAALQELTRNPDLKTGSVSNALRVVTETVVYTLDEARAGLWLLTENGERMGCLDIYDREQMHHAEAVEFIRADSPYLFNNLMHDEILVLDYDTPNEHPLRILQKSYPYFAATTAFMASPIHLTGKVVGMFMVESTLPGRRWHADEKNFLMSAADIISLALEQGNSRAVAEELSATLEQALAMEEELRQNAEELETTNEEMRRTHIELNGQINALNNAAIVTETNRQGLIMYANAEYLNTYGLQSREVIGQKNSIVSSGEHSEAFWKNLWETILDGRVWKGEIKNRTRSGEFRWMATTITPVFGADGTPFKFISVSFDITEQKRQEEEAKNALRIALEKERQLQTQSLALTTATTEMRRTQIELVGQIKALDNSCMVYETDMEGAITFANEALLRATGYDWEELKGQRYTVLKSGRQPESLYQDQWRTVLNGNVWKGELELKTRSGEYLWIIMTNTPVLDQNQEPIKCINVLVNITEQKMQELRLKKQQSALMEISNHPAVRDGKKNEAFAFITKIGVETLNVARCSIWFFIENGRKVRCQTTYQKDDYQHQYAPGSELDREMYPTFFKTLDLERIIAAGDAVNDPRTKEMAFTLLKPTGVTATIDCAIKQGAKTIGILSLEHRETPRQWTLDEISFVTSLADTVARTIEQKERQNTQKLKQAYAQLEEAKKQEEEARQEILAQKLKLEEATESLRQSIKYAKRIQHSILPSSEMLDKYLGADKYFVQHKQRDVVGGDFYWFAAHGSKRVIVIADGTGHGVPGAFLTLIGYLLLKQIVNEKLILTPSEILYQLNLGVRTALKQDEEDAKMRDGMDVAICTFDVDTLVAEYAGANLAFYYYQDWEIHEVKPTKKPIGGEQLEDERHYDNHTIQLKPGDAFYMFTDGFVDQFGGPGTEEKRFSTRRFRELVLRIQHDTMRAQRALINMEWKDWKGDREQLDDVTIFGYKV
jgi:PAS domain S-box-containing protein